MSSEPAVNAIVKDNALKVMKELDQRLSTYNKMYLDMYHAQIHLFERLIETMYASRDSAWSSVFGTPQGKTAFGWWAQLYANGAIYNLDAYKRFLQWYSQMRLNGLRNMDEQIRVFMEYYDRVSHSAKPPRRDGDDTKKTPPKGAAGPRRKVASKRGVTKTARAVRRTRKTAK